jgi:hypothetical protein
MALSRYYIILHVHTYLPLYNDRALFPLINRRDVLSLAHENLASAHASTIDALSNVEVENIRTTKKNQELVRTLLELTSHEKSWKEEVTDPNLKSQLQTLEEERKAARAKKETIKSVVSAAIVASGVDWARDEALRELVVEDDDDESMDV